METGSYIHSVVELQEKKNGRKVPVDILLANGNILLRSFHILSFDETKGEIKGLTMQEEYFHLKENRPPVYCRIKVDEIKEISMAECEPVYA